MTKKDYMKSFKLETESRSMVGEVLHVVANNTFYYSRLVRGCGGDSLFLL